MISLGAVILGLLALLFLERRKRHQALNEAMAARSDNPYGRMNSGGWFADAKHADSSSNITGFKPEMPNNEKFITPELDGTTAIREQK